MFVHLILVKDEHNEFSRDDFKETLQGVVSFVFWFVSLTLQLLTLSFLGCSIFENCKRCNNGTWGPRDDFFIGGEYCAECRPGWSGGDCMSKSLHFSN